MVKIADTGSGDVVYCYCPRGYVGPCADYQNIQQDYTASQKDSCSYASGCISKRWRRTCKSYYSARPLWILRKLNHLAAKR